MGALLLIVLISPLLIHLLFSPLIGLISLPRGSAGSTEYVAHETVSARQARVQAETKAN